MKMTWPRVLALTATVLLPACLPTATRDATPEPALVWPAGPAQPRIAFVRSLSRPEDLGISRGLIDRMKDLLFGEAEHRLVRPMAVVAVDGVIYVADPGARGVHRFDPARNGYALIGAAGGNSLPSPVGLARGDDGAVYVADSKLAQVLLIRPGAKEALPLQLKAALRQPTGIAFDAVAGRLFVADTTAHQIKVFDRDGALEQTIGSRGTGPGEFNFPTLLWRSPQGHLHVTDALNFRIQTFDEKGRVVGMFGRQGDGSGDAARPKGVATDRYGHIYVVDALFHAVQIFDASGKFLLALGQRGQARGEFWLPAGIFIDGNDTIYVADTYNRRVQVLRHVGGSA